MLFPTYCFLFVLKMAVHTFSQLGTNFKMQILNRISLSFS